MDAAQTYTSRNVNGLLTGALVSLCALSMTLGVACTGAPLSGTANFCDQYGGDQDGDEVCDNADPCPMSNPDDPDGDGVCGVATEPTPCFDQDGDGVCDDADPCPASNPDDPDGDGVCGVAVRDCQVGEWSNWSDCSASCGGGTQTRIRSVLEEPSFGEACPELLETQQCNTQACAEPPAANCVRLFDECGFRGEYYDVCEDNPGIWDFNDRASSVMLGANIDRVELYASGDYASSSMTVTEDTSCIAGSPVYEDVSAVKLLRSVEPGCVRLYDGCYFLGEYYDVCEDNPGIWDFNDRASSVRLGAGLESVTLYSGGNYVDGRTLTEEDSCLGSLNDQVSSVELR